MYIYTRGQCSNNLRTLERVFRQDTGPRWTDWMNNDYYWIRICFLYPHSYHKTGKCVFSVSSLYMSEFLDSLWSNRANQSDSTSTAGNRLRWLHSTSNGDNQVTNYSPVMPSSLFSFTFAQTPTGTEWQIELPNHNCAQPPASGNIMEAFNYASNYTGSWQLSCTHFYSLISPSVMQA